MSLSISAFSGIRGREKGESPRIGFILAVSKLKIDLPFFKAGSIISIKTKEVENLAPVYIFDGEIFLDGKSVLTGKLTVMDVDEEQAKSFKKENE